MTTANQVVQRAQVASVPVFQYGGGGFVLSFPVMTGDTGWIKANDRDISLFKQTTAASSPNTARLHDFADAMFFPDTLLNGVTIATEDAANAVLQNFAGTVKVALWSDLIKILAPQGVGINGTPDANAILDLQSTTQAFLPPRMTTAQKLAIPSPKIGMTVYDTTELGLSTYNGSAWS
ncbi:Gp138 family membrane-puncturing spike protein [Fimbriiglobus ruber]|uniref:Phage-related protein n=1 Tax=Fimbriiglobus ruber TaxID=1908690 RepID=A0A225D5N2_9BACT|nr:Gp138 family membrane-puncturing spike protein [Fimbriiglobus ruber]OWK36890.1 Phage-related protein [Fimbriiglobus ruber]